jgi:hypothetical protein
MNFKPATHILYRTDFKDDSMWDWILEAHGIEQSEEDGIQYDEITIRATVEGVE